MFFCAIIVPKDKNSQGKILLTTLTTSVMNMTFILSVTGLTAATSVGAVVLLILFLTTKELAGASSSGFSLRIAKFVSVGILPLVMAFAVIVAMKIVEVLA